MSYMLSYLRWRIITGLIMTIISVVILSTTGIGARFRYAQLSAAEMEEARQRYDQYEAEREIRRARQTGGYDPSDPAIVRDGYTQSDGYYSSNSGTEPYGTNPSE